jgi:protein-tyrosine-phosphatase
MFPGAKTIEWDLPNPKGKPVEFMRDLRDTIEEKIINFIKELF